MPKHIDIAGQIFGQLTVQHLDRTTWRPVDDTRAYWLCRCTCGNTRVAVSYRLRKNFVTCCHQCSKFWTRSKIAAAQELRNDRHLSYAQIGKDIGVSGAAVSKMFQRQART